MANGIMKIEESDWMHVEVCKVIVQLAGGQQLGIQADLVLADIPQVSLSPNADGSALRLVLLEL